MTGTPVAALYVVTGFVGNHVPAGHAAPIAAYAVLAAVLVFVLGSFALRARGRRRD